MLPTSALRCLSFVVAALILPLCSAKEQRHSRGYGADCLMNDQTQCLLGLSCANHRCHCQRSDCLDKFVNISFKLEQESLTLFYTIQQENDSVTPYQICHRNISTNEDISKNEDVPDVCHKLEGDGNESFPAPNPERTYAFQLLLNDSLKGKVSELNKTYHRLLHTYTEDPDGTLTVKWNPQASSEIKEVVCLLGTPGGLPPIRSSTKDVSSITRGGDLCRFSGLPPLQRFDHLEVRMTNSLNYIETFVEDWTVDYVVIPRVVHNVTVTQVNVSDVHLSVEELPLPSNVTVGFYVINGTGFGCVAFQRTPSCVMPKELGGCKTLPITTTTTSAVTTKFTVTPAITTVSKNTPSPSATKPLRETSSSKDILETSTKLPSAGETSKISSVLSTSTSTTTAAVTTLPVTTTTTTAATTTAAVTTLPVTTTTTTAAVTTLPVTTTTTTAAVTTLPVTTTTTTAAVTTLPVTTTTTTAAVTTLPVTTTTTAKMTTEARRTTKKKKVPTTSTSTGTTTAKRTTSNSIPRQPSQPENTPSDRRRRRRDAKAGTPPPPTKRPPSQNDVNPAAAAADDDDDDEDDAGDGRVVLVVAGLQASSTYSFQVTPWFCNSTEVKGKVTSLNPVSTLVQVQAQAVTAEVEEGGRGGSKVVVEWMTPPVPENVTYTVYLVDNCPAGVKPGSREELCQVSYEKGKANGTCSGSAHNAFWEYDVVVEATTKHGTATTKSSGPKVPLARYWTRKRKEKCGEEKLEDYYKICVTWADFCPRQQNVSIERYVCSLTQGGVEVEGTPRFVQSSISDGQYRNEVKQSHYYVILAVTPGQTYNLTVFAITTQGVRGENQTREIRIPDVQGPNLTQSKVNEQVLDDSLVPRETSIEFWVKGTRFLHAEGDATASTTGQGVVLTAGGYSPLDIHSIKEFERYPSWQENNTNALQTGGYRIKEETLAVVHDEPIKVVIGDKVCDKTGTHHNSDDFCDGPLTKGTTYSVWVYVCNKEDCIKTILVQNITTAGGPGKDLTSGSTRSIVATVAVAIFIFACIFSVWYFCFRNKRSGNARMQDGQELSEWKTLQDIKEPRAKRPMKLVSLENIICKKQRDDCLLLREEYDDIVQSFTDPNTCRYKHRPHHTGTMEINRTKNRYNDIVTYDHSRVKLSRDKECSDYINANFIPGYKSEKDFIATQGPLPFTTQDFWRMVWEHNVSVLVMLTLPKEAGRIKCEQYWPTQRGEVSDYDDIQVTNLSTSTLNDYCITIFSIQNCKTKENAREVRHFHYLKWKDMTADVVVSSVLEFHRVIQQHAHPDKPGPMVVHCSAGVGRTGAFIALDYVQQAISNRSMKEDLDIYGFVMLMRQFRCNMVQTTDQYLFIHQCARVLMAMRRKQEAEQGVGRLSYAHSTSSLVSQTSPKLPRGNLDPTFIRPDSKVTFADCRLSPTRIGGVSAAVHGVTPSSSTDNLFLP